MAQPDGYTNVRSISRLALLSELSDAVSPAPWEGLFAWPNQTDTDQLSKDTLDRLRHLVGDGSRSAADSERRTLDHERGVELVASAVAAARSVPGRRQRNASSKSDSSLHQVVGDSGRADGRAGRVSPISDELRDEIQESLAAISRRQRQILAISLGLVLLVSLAIFANLVLGRA